MLQFYTVCAVIELNVVGVADNEDDVLTCRIKLLEIEKGMFLIFQ
jgi:hypothetical protein